MPENTETYRTVTPYLVVRDAELEMSFLKEAFDATEVLCHRTEDGRVMHAELKIGDSLVMLGEGPAGESLPASLYLWVPSVDVTYERAVQAGAASKAAPEDKAYGHRNAAVEDKNGISWWIGAPVQSNG